jgi:anti-sigma factor ChrR (cupin superfamily)
MTGFIRIETERAEWQPTSTPGVTFQSLRYDRETKAGAVLIKMEPGTSYPAHEHTKGEDVFIVEGELIVGKERFPKGTYLYSPPGSVHTPRTEKGCVLFSTFPGKIDHHPSKP